MMEDMSSGRPGIRGSAFEVRVRVSREEEEEGEIGISSFPFIFVVCVKLGANLYTFLLAMFPDSLSVSGVNAFR